MNNVSKNKPERSINIRFLGIAATFSCKVRDLSNDRIQAQETGWQLGVRACFMPGLPTHKVQEANAGIVRHLFKFEL